MLSQKELIEKSESLLMQAVDDIANENVSPVRAANKLGAAQLLFDMAHSEIFFPYGADHCQAQELSPELREVIERIF